MTATSESLSDVHGYDAVFEPSLDKRYMCPVCLTALRDPVQTVCGHRFCRGCLYTAMGNRKKGKCPVDNTWFNSAKHIFEDNAVKREVLSLTVKCYRHEEGCQWKGELRVLEAHVSECEYVIVRCENCEEEVSRRDLASHLYACPRRIANCDHCRAAVVFVDLPKHQLLVCDKFPVNCVICGETEILREDISRHLDVMEGDCPLVTVPCDYVKLGCCFQDKRTNMGEHYKRTNQYHQSLCVSKIHNLTEQLAEQVTVTSQMKEELSQCHSIIDRQNRMFESQEESRLVSGGCSGRLLWKVLLSDCNGRKVTSPTFYTATPGYKVKAVFDIHGCVEDNVTYSSVILKLERGRYDGRLNNQPFLGQCRVTVLQQDNFRPSSLSAAFRGQGQLPRSEGQAVTLGTRWKFAKLSELMQGTYLKDGFLVLEICVNHIVT